MFRFGYMRPILPLMLIVVRVKSAKPGENVTVKIGCSDSDVMKGFVLCSKALPCHAATLFVAQVALVELTEQVQDERAPVLCPPKRAVCHDQK